MNPEFVGRGGVRGKQKGGGSRKMRALSNSEMPPHHELEY